MDTFGIVATVISVSVGCLGTYWTWKGVQMQKRIAPIAFGMAESLMLFWAKLDCVASGAGDLKTLAKDYRNLVDITISQLGGMNTDFAKTWANHWPNEEDRKYWMNVFNL